ncbi:hypothetical protein DPMN_079918 [Dreissena polymorpha]|uniref:Uncharacterized protein n=1 Tax=Dreissena polymorpha TaxID=45954 RepID=A0A9D3YPW5_DREPO|nr:hypothetical protein DPMN_079918 [Dreissena polymorpha]
MKDVFSEPPLVAFRRDCNLQDMVKNHIQSAKRDTYYYPGGMDPLVWTFLGDTINAHFVR